jgi:hypothetical protein
LQEAGRHLTTGVGIGICGRTAGICRRGSAVGPRLRRGARSPGRAEPAECPGRRLQHAIVAAEPNHPVRADGLEHAPANLVLPDLSRPAFLNLLQERRLRPSTITTP